MNKVLLTFLLLFLTNGISKAQDARTIIEKAISVLNTSNSYKYTFKSSERINGSMINSTMKVKLMQSPHKIYLNNIAGKNEGKELLYVAGENKNKVLVNVAWGFSLDPFSSLIRKGNHYTVLDSGFKNVKSTLASAKKKADAQGRFDEVFKYTGQVEFAGRTCYKLEINDPTFTYVNYTIKNGESLYQIAKKLNVCEQLIIEKNSSLSGFDSGKDGMTIKVPSSYAMKSVIYVDAKNYHVIYQEVHDDKGLFEKYIFQNLIINPSFKSDEFTEDFEGYNF